MYGRPMKIPYSRKHWHRLFGEEKFGKWPNNGKWILKIP